jgi:taurine--2-oxoglutarate transaminase
MIGDLTGQEIGDLSRQTTLFEWTAQRAMSPLVVAHAKGIYFWDADGTRYMDFNSQLMCVNIGHGDERVINAIRRRWTGSATSRRPPRRRPCAPS